MWYDGLIYVVKMSVCFISGPHSGCALSSLQSWWEMACFSQWWQHSKGKSYPVLLTFRNCVALYVNVGNLVFNVYSHSALYLAVGSHSRQDDHWIHVTHISSQCCAVPPQWVPARLWECRSVLSVFVCECVSEWRVGVCLYIMRLEFNVFDAALAQVC